MQAAWRNTRKVSDLFTVVPRAYAEDFQWALEASCCSGRTKRRLCRQLEFKCEANALQFSDNYRGWLRSFTSASLLHWQRRQLMAKTFGKSMSERMAPKNETISRMSSVGRNELSLRVRSLKRGACAGPLCPGHFAYGPLAKAIGEAQIRFIDPEFRSSRVEIGKGRWADSFVALERSCGAKQERELCRGAELPATGE